ncbi:MAG: hypothetical protein LBS36_10775 [Oscillospiraceae bacterium]|jgi:ABC-type phosphate transport system substrate-binding protein|nr:hypothetical protein [Oscillospiraceae bacterium]
MMKIFKSGLCMLFAFLLLAGLAGCGDGSSGENLTSQSETQETGKTTNPQEEWVTLIEFDGTFAGDDKEAFSDVFEVSGGNLRITYDLVTNSTGGNALIYILPEGWTKTKDSEGNLKVSVQDISAVGNKTGEQKIIKKDAGKYFIDLNSSSVKSYKIKIEEKK